MGIASNDPTKLRFLHVIHMFAQRLVHADLAEVPPPPRCTPPHPIQCPSSPTRHSSHHTAHPGPSAQVPVKIVVEVQYMMADYYAMRKKTHAWYKIARADLPLTMMIDFQGGLGKVALPEKAKDVMSTLLGKGCVNAVEKVVGVDIDGDGTIGGVERVKKRETRESLPQVREFLPEAPAPRRPPPASAALARGHSMKAF